MLILTAAIHSEPPAAHSNIVKVIPMTFDVPLLINLCTRAAPFLGDSFTLRGS